MDDKLTITLNIADRNHPLRIDRSKEEFARKAAKMVNERAAAYQVKYENIELGAKDFYALTAFQIAFELYLLAEEKGAEPILEKITELNRDLEEFLNDK